MKNLLVLSDMHVGRDCNEITGFKQERPNPEFDQAFIKLLNHYTTNHETDWKLVIGGDFIDFMEVVVIPSDETRFGMAVSFEVTDEEREFGLGSEAERVLVKLERTFRYHAAFFDRLSQFVKNGGELVLVRGNHDVEFFWPKVQRVFRRTLSDLAYADGQFEVDEAIELRASFQDRITFEDWFYFEEGRLYLEHGNQYDTYCSFDHWLYPVSPYNPRRIDTPVSLFAMRYFVNILSDFSPHNADYWSFADYLAWLRAKKASELFYVTKTALGTVYRLLEYAVRWSLGNVRAYQKEHQKALKTLAAEKNIPLAKLKQIDQQHHVPVSRNLPELMRLLFLDRFLLVLGTLGLSTFWFLVLDFGWVLALCVLATVAIGLRVNQLLVPRRYFLPGPKQALAAKKIAKILGVPYVVMGHSHQPRRAKLDRQSVYLNTGCWLPGGKKDQSQTEESFQKGPILCHLVIDKSNQAELRVFDPEQVSWSVADVPSEKSLIDLPIISIAPPAG